MTASKIIRKVCKECGKPYGTVNPKGEYCSTRCRVKAHRASMGAGKKKEVAEKARERPPVQRVPRAFLEMLRAVVPGCDKEGMRAEILSNTKLTGNQREMLIAKLKNLE